MLRIVFLFLFTISVIFAEENYVIIKNKSVKAYADTLEGSEYVTTFKSGQRYDLVEYDDNFVKIFYREKDGLDYVAYIKRKDVYIREVNKEKALAKIKELNDFVTKKIAENKTLVVTQTYAYDQELDGQKNTLDAEGERAANASKFYKSPDEKSKWYYYPDRSLVAIEGYEKDFVKLSVPSRDNFLYIKKSKFKFTKESKFTGLIEKVVFVDRINQNTQLYDYAGGEFLLTHSSKSTSGYNNNINSYRTPKGFYIVSNIKPFMMYYEDAKPEDVEKKTGRALYAVRFSGGYYLHGIPLKDELKGEEREITRKRVASILGSHPSSHGCVRNSDEDAKFIYDWTNSLEIRKGYFVPEYPVAVIVSD